jgi:hypothetical protein
MDIDDSDGVLDTRNRCERNVAAAHGPCGFGTILAASRIKNNDGVND